MYSLAIFLPLIGALIAGFFGRTIGDRGAQLVTCGLVILAAAISIVAFVDIAVLGNTYHADLGTWIASGTFEARWALRFDALTAVISFTRFTICLAVSCGIPCFRLIC